MKRGLAIFVWASLLSQDCLALRKPDPDSNRLDQAMLVRANEAIADAHEDQASIDKNLAELRIKAQAWATADAESRKKLEDEMTDIRRDMLLEKAARDFEYGRAANIVVKLYDITPSIRTAPSVMGPPFTDVQATWHVTAGDPLKRTVNDKNGELHEVDPEDVSDYAATTFDGFVRVHPKAFDDIRLLASTLYHESIHFHQYITPGDGDRKNHDQREAAAYDAEIKSCTVFGFDPNGDYVKGLEHLRDSYSQGIDPLPRRSDWYQHPPGHDNKEMDEDVDLYPHTGNELGVIKSDAQLLEESVDEEFRARAAEIERQRREDAERQHLLSAWQQIGAAAAQCGFAMDMNNGHFSANGVPPFVIYHEGDVEAAKAALLMARTCVERGQSRAPCNDAAGAIARRWDEPRFKDRVMMWVTDAPSFDNTSAYGLCLLHLRYYWHPRGDFKDLRRAAAKYYPKPGNPSDSDGGESPATDDGGGQGTPRAAPVPRGEPAPPSRGGSGQCYWSNDGREICP